MRAKLLWLLLAAALLIIGLRIHDATPDMRLGDFVAFSVLGSTLALEAIILFCGFADWRGSPDRRALDELRAEIALQSRDKAARSPGRQRPI